LMDKLEWSKVRDNVAIHVPCSSKKMGIEAAFNAVAQKCSHQITSSDVPCCGKPKLLLSLCVVIDSTADHVAGMNKTACIWLATFSFVTRGTCVQFLHAYTCCKQTLHPCCLCPQCGHVILCLLYNAGMAGDRGMRYPELTGAALQHLQTNGCTDGYSTSRTCEISLSNHSGINFRGLVYLADEATRPKQQQQQQAA